MSSLPTVTGSEAVRAFTRLGFSLDRVAGSHHIMKRPGHQFLLSVPVHKNKPLKRGTLRSLINDAGVTVDQFVEALNS